MGKKIVIDESDLKEIINEAVTNAVDKVTQKLTRHVARERYHNMIFEHKIATPVTCGYDECGDAYGCGSSVSNGGCGGSSRGLGSGSCGGGYDSGSC